jgi:isoamylase
MSWFDWSLCQRHKDLHRFVSFLIQLRLRFAAGPRGTSLSLTEFIERARIQWHGTQLWAPDLSADSHSLAATAYIKNEGRFHLMFNAYWEPLDFEFPVVPADCGPWRPLIDTFQDVPSDFPERESEMQRHTGYTVQSRSIVLLTTGRCGD